MEQIRQELAGYRLPAYIEDILVGNYCPGFLRMSMLREQERYIFNYKPGALRRLDYKDMSLYEKLILLDTVIKLSEWNKDYLINPDTYLIEPELIYLKDKKVSGRDVRLMYYPDVKSLSFRYKLVLFADRILDKSVREERAVLDQIRQASDSGDINKIKLFLDKSITRLERMIQ